MKSLYKIFVLLLPVLLYSCTTKFIPEIDEYDNIIVVEGLLTNEENSSYVKISRTIPTGITGLSSPVVDAHVYIKNELNEAVVFYEDRPGYYIPVSPGFKGETGITYTLFILTDNKQYESSPMLMREVPAIDSLYSEFEFTDDGSRYPPLYTYDVYFDSYDSSVNNKYFRWTYEEVWEYHLPWHYPPDYKRICWISEESSDILIKNNSTLEQSVVDRFHLVHLDNWSSSKLFQKYSIQLKQYSISENEYIFWETMKKMTDEQGGLYDPIPAPLTGNIISVHDPAEPVLGYFSVSAVSTKRLFIDNDTIKYLPGGQYCVTDTAATIEEISGLNKHVFILEEVDEVGFLLSTFEQCADCRLSGTNIPPSFWYDKK